MEIVIENWIELIVGALILISPWLFGFADILLARWGNVICGLTLIIANVWSLYGNAPQIALVPSRKNITTKKLKNNKSRPTV